MSDYQSGCNGELPVANTPVLTKQHVQLLRDAADDCQAEANNLLNQAPNMGPTKERSYRRQADECMQRAEELRIWANELEQAEPTAPLPRGACVTLLLPGFPSMPRDGWTIENIDEPRPLKYRIRHPNGSLLDVLPECIAVNRGGDA